MSCVVPALARRGTAILMTVALGALTGWPAAGDPVQGEAPAVRELAGQLVCTFSAGTATSYDNGAFAAKPASALSFRIADIDLEGQTAALTADQDQRPLQVRIVRAINANHFLEVVNEGFLNLTTIYDKDIAAGVHPAVHSRHLGLLGQPFFAQYSGTCREE